MAQNMLNQKRCSSCKEWKPFTEFHRRGGDKLRPRCRICTSRDNKVAYKYDPIRDRQKVEAKSKKRSELKKELLLLQGGRCALCREYLVVDKAVLDHKHTACCPEWKALPCEDCRRGVTCRPCNLGIGCFRDNPFLLKEAINYLSLYEGR